MAVAARGTHALHVLQAWLPSLRRTEATSHGPIMSRRARDACSRAERGHEFGRRSRAHLDGLRPLLLHVPHHMPFGAHCVKDQPLLRRTRAYAAFVREADQHMGTTRGAWSKWHVQVTKSHFTTRSRAAGGVPEIDQGGTPSMVDTKQR